MLDKEEPTTILAYGTSGSGKTHTITNLLERVIRSRPGPFLKISIQEIYRDRCQELLCRDEVQRENVSRVLAKHLKNRKTCATPLNPKSSRSHFIIQLDHITLIDLPGSEPYTNRELLMDQTNSSLFFLREYLQKKACEEFQTGRDCALSKFLKGNVVMILCLNASGIEREQRATLEFGTFSRKIKLQQINS